MNIHHLIKLGKFKSFKSSNPQKTFFMYVYIIITKKFYLKTFYLYLICLNSMRFQSQLLVLPELLSWHIFNTSNMSLFL